MNDFIFITPAGGHIVLKNCTVAGNGVIGETKTGELTRLDDSEYIDMIPLNRNA